MGKKRVLAKYPILKFSSFNMDFIRKSTNVEYGVNYLKIKYY